MIYHRHLTVALEHHSVAIGLVEVLVLGANDVWLALKSRCEIGSRHLVYLHNLSSRRVGNGLIELHLLVVERGEGGHKRHGNERILLSLQAGIEVSLTSHHTALVGQRCPVPSVEDAQRSHSPRAVALFHGQVACTVESRFVGIVYSVRVHLRSRIALHGVRSRYSYIGKRVAVVVGSEVYVAQVYSVGLAVSVSLEHVEVEVDLVLCCAATVGEQSHRRLVDYKLELTSYLFALGVRRCHLYGKRHVVGTAVGHTVVVLPLLLAVSSP